MYIATEEDRLWLQSVQRKLYARSRDNPDYRFDELWGLVTDPRNLRIAFSRVQRNRGARTAGIDRVTVREGVQSGVDTVLAAVRQGSPGRVVSPEPGAACAHPEGRQAGGLPAARHPDCTRPGHSSGDEAGAGAD